MPSPEKGIDRDTGEIVVQVDPHYFRPTEVDILLGDRSKTKEILCWEPKYSLEDLVRIMVKSDPIRARKNEHLKNGGHEVDKCLGLTQK